MTEKRVVRRIAIRNLQNTDKRNERVFDVLIGEKDVYLEIRMGKTKSEVIPLKDVVRQIKIAATQSQSPVANVPSG